jgi:hypothetical protein
MKRLVLGCVLLTQAVHAEDLNPLLQRLVTCQDSWQDLGSDQARIKRFVDALDAQFVRDDKKRLHVPRKDVTYLGFPVFEMTPESVGMGVGFGVTVKAPFDTVRKSFEKALGKTLKDCDASDGMKFCGLEIGPKRTVMMIGPATKPEQGTLIGCYYEYQK